MKISTNVPSAGVLLVGASVFFLSLSDYLTLVPLGLLLLAIVGAFWKSVGFRETLIGLVVLVQMTSGLIERLDERLSLLAPALLIVLLVMAAIARPKIALPLPIRLGILGYVTSVAALGVVSMIRGPIFGLHGMYSLLVPIAAVAVGLGRAGDTGDGRSWWTDPVLCAGALGLLFNVVLGFRQAIFGLSAEEEAAAVRANSAYLVGDQARLMGALPTNQDYGLLCALSAPLLLVLCFRETGIRRYLALSGSVCCLILSWLTLLRGSFIAAVVVCGLMAILPAAGVARRKLPAIAAYLVAVPAVLVMGYKYLPQSRVEAAVSRTSSLFDLSSDSSFVARDRYTLPIAINAFEQNIFGAGVGAAGPVSQSYPAVAPYGALIPDNGYLSLAIQIGLIGTVSILIAIVYAAVVLVRSDGAWGCFGAALIVLLVGFAFGGYWGLLGPISVLGIFVGIGIRSVTEISPASSQFGAYRLKSYASA
ncbi:MAG: hypothetical protein EON54_01210 [Alcaligenaceae bacterium]|nr:MAG: hypothetical protein EON54_01210 [Alcaligenaceae bacterium]